MKKLVLMLTIFALLLTGRGVYAVEYDLTEIETIIYTPYFHYAGGGTQMSGSYDLDVEFADSDGVHDLPVELWRIDHDGNKVEQLESVTISIDNGTEIYLYSFESSADYPYQLEAGGEVIRKGYVKPWDANRLQVDFHENVPPDLEPKVHIGPTIYNLGAIHSPDDLDYNTSPDDYPAMHYTGFENEPGDYFVRFSHNGDSNFNGLDIRINEVYNQFDDTGFLILPTGPGWVDFIDEGLHAWYNDHILSHTMATFVVATEETYDTDPLYPTYFTDEGLDLANIYYNGVGGAPPEALPFLAAYGLMDPANDYYSLLDMHDGGVLWFYYQNFPGDIYMTALSSEIEVGDLVEIDLSGMPENASFNTGTLDYGIFDRGAKLYDFKEPLILDDHNHVMELDLNNDIFTLGDTVIATLSIPNEGVRGTYEAIPEPYNAETVAWVDEAMSEGSATYSFNTTTTGEQSISVTLDSTSSYRNDSFNTESTYTVEEVVPINERIDGWFDFDGVNTDFYKLLVGLALLAFITIALAFMNAGFGAIIVSNIIGLMVLIALGFIPSWLLVILGLGAFTLVFLVAFHYYGGVK